MSSSLAAAESDNGSHKSFIVKYNQREKGDWLLPLQLYCHWTVRCILLSRLLFIYLFIYLKEVVCYFLLTCKAHSWERCLVSSENYKASNQGGSSQLSSTLFSLEFEIKGWESPAIRSCPLLLVGNQEYWQNLVLIEASGASLTSQQKKCNWEKELT